MVIADRAKRRDQPGATQPERRRRPAIRPTTRTRRRSSSGAASSPRARGPCTGPRSRVALVRRELAVADRLEDHTDGPHSHPEPDQPGPARSGDRGPCTGSDTNHTAPSLHEEDPADSSPGPPVAEHFAYRGSSSGARASAGHVPASRRPHAADHVSSCRPPVRAPTAKGHDHRDDREARAPDDVDDGDASRPGGR